MLQVGGVLQPARQPEDVLARPQRLFAAERDRFRGTLRLAHGICRRKRLLVLREEQGERIEIASIIRAGQRNCQAPERDFPVLRDLDHDAHQRAVFIADQHRMNRPFHGRGDSVNRLGGSDRRHDAQQQRDDQQLQPLQRRVRESRVFHDDISFTRGHNRITPYNHQRVPGGL